MMVEDGSNVSMIVTLARVNVGVEVLGAGEVEV